MKRQKPQPVPEGGTKTGPKPREKAVSGRWMPRKPSFVASGLPAGGVKCANALWRELASSLAGAGLLRPQDVTVLREYVLTSVRLDDVWERLYSEGLTQDDVRHNTSRRNPLAVYAASLQARLGQLENRLRLGAVARPSVDAPLPPAYVNPADDPEVQAQIDRIIAGGE